MVAQASPARAAMAATALRAARLRAAAAHQERAFDPRRRAAAVLPPQQQPGGGRDFHAAAFTHAPAARASRARHRRTRPNLGVHAAGVKVSALLFFSAGGAAEAVTKSARLCACFFINADGAHSHAARQTVSVRQRTGGVYLTADATRAAVRAACVTQPVLRAAQRITQRMLIILVLLLIIIIISVVAGPSARAPGANVDVGIGAHEGAQERERVLQLFIIVIAI